MLCWVLCLCKVFIRVIISCVFEVLIGWFSVYVLLFMLILLCGIFSLSMGVIVMMVNVLLILNRLIWFSV